MIEAQLKEAVQADEQQKVRIIRELTSHPDETLEAIIQILRHPGALGKIAIEIVRTIGYPRNESAIPILLGHVKDKNSYIWEEAVQTLADIGPDVVVPYLIQSIWDRTSHVYWDDDVEGMCLMLTTLDRAYAVACGPTLVYILGRSDLPPDRDLDKGFLLDVLEKIGPDNVIYALPTLIDLASREGTSDVGKQARRLIQSFSEEALEPYKFLLDAIAEKPE